MASIAQIEFVKIIGFIKTGNLKLLKSILNNIITIIAKIVIKKVTILVSENKKYDIITTNTF
jgi:hypothetical protein